jgi:KDEL-tailed cysteine endopeptidase
MKGAAILTILLAVGATYVFFNTVSVADPLEAKYHEYLAQYRKSYANSNEYSLRLGIFKENLRKIEEHNRKNGVTYTLAMNQFGDMTPEEFRRHLGYAPIKNKLPAAPLTGEAAASVDWRAKNAVNPVQNQGSCGSCWAFSATGAVEGSYALATGNLVKFSEQQLVDCSTDGNFGCNGGLMTNAFEYLTKNKFCTAEDYPYNARDGTCKANQCKHALQAVSGFREVPTNSDKETKRALNLGPVAVAVQADKAPFMFYSSGVVDDVSCGTNLNHGILAVGYGTDEKGQGYYIVKNSWGSGWGEQGYIRIASDTNVKGGVCGILLDNSYSESESIQTTSV